MNDRNTTDNKRKTDMGGADTQVFIQGDTQFKEDMNFYQENRNNL